MYCLTHTKRRSKIGDIPRKDCSKHAGAPAKVLQMDLVELQRLLGPALSLHRGRVWMTAQEVLSNVATHNG